MDRDRERSFGGNNDCKVYVGNLPADIRARDLEDIFYKYGKIVDVDLHDRRGPPFAFVEFEDPRFVSGASIILLHLTLKTTGMRMTLLGAGMATRLMATVFEWNSLGRHLAALAPTDVRLGAMAVPATGLKVTSFSCPAYHPLAPGRCVQ